MKIAINRNVINKPDSEQIKKMTFTYENVDITEKELANLVNQGHAFCAQHKNNYRKNMNFIASDFLAVDIDKGMLLEDALSDDFVQNNASFLYTTPSHTEDFPRFRIVFALSRSITNRTEMKNAYMGIIKKFGGDPSCHDACRQFFGSKNGLRKIYGKTLSNIGLDKIIALGKESQLQNDNKTKQSSSRSTIRSNVTIDLDTSVIDKDGNIHRLGDLPPKTMIHCPIHLDKKPSAFTLRSKNGVVGLHCSACSTTYFTSGDLPLYDFNYGLEKLKSLGKIIYQDGLLTYEKNAVICMNERYLPILNLESQYIFVKSPKGTGKTHWLEHVVTQCKKKRLSVLLIGHRQSLISSIAHRLQLQSYIYYSSEKSRTVIKNNPPSKYYAICADSLPKLLTPSQNKYDVILIDEVEQVLSHLTENTVKDKRNQVFLYFKHYVRNAKTIYVMDADLNKVTVDAIINFGDLNETNWNFIINEYKPVGKSLDLYGNQFHLIHELLISLNLGNKCFICSNSKAKIKKLKKALIDNFGESKKILSITSDNSSQKSIQDFIRNIQNQILDYDAVMVSPSVGTGVDITFPNNEQKIDCVFGFFEARVNTHFDIDQQISRVRHPKSIKISISPETFRFEHDPHIIKREVIESNMASRKLIGINSDGALQYDDDWTREYLDLYANVISMKRGSKNNLTYHYKKMKEHYGWSINPVIGGFQDFLSGLSIIRKGEYLLQEEEKKHILNAKLITTKEYKALDTISKNMFLTNHQQYAMRRYEIESFYYQEISEDLLKQDDNGRLRYRLREYDNYMASKFDLLMRDIMDGKKDSPFTDKKACFLRKELLKTLFLSARIVDKNYNLLANNPIQGNQLLDFVKCFKQNKDRIARYFNMDINKDIDDKPARQLGSLLRLIGVFWIRKSYKRKGKKIYEYHIDQSNIDNIENIITKRRNKDIASEWHEKRENASGNRLLPDDNYNLHLRIKNQIYENGK